MGMLLGIVDVLLMLLWLAVLARTFLDWLLTNHEHENPPLVRALHWITNPILNPLRRVIPQDMLFDITPWVAVAIIIVIQQILVPDGTLVPGYEYVEP
ncbi:MAG: YggT family protein [Chloroflexi bacterium]|nr:YggT family protein [Chloroflexota bacterium]